MASLLDRLRNHYGRSSEELEADELHERAGAIGATHVRDVQERSLADLSGVIRTLTHTCSSNPPHLAVELFDGTGSVQLVWLGRRAIRGIEPGVYLRAHGRVTRRAGVLTIYNPRYEILPRG
ncbi:OB-fold nucleic acid binding domain-containing protein [Gephyromycinifex aptenodytis]|uniref:OB-fold nucleic acid binding domain-containing protein n=1 Tax=Gephyromycinifex aptenodytis TaxID=2716227 RepID=UPI001447587C|nr:OB-fold nucleic acid binding domain-containing protein [Gephyromycinifex aptenodytis]